MNNDKTCSKHDECFGRIDDKLDSLEKKMDLVIEFSNTRLTTLEDNTVKKDTFNLAVTIVSAIIAGSLTLGFIATKDVYAEIDKFKTAINKCDFSDY